MIPGGVNLLAMANGLIGFQTGKLNRWRMNSTTSEGIDNPVYYAPIDLSASIQPTPRTVYEQLGLDLQKDYVTVYTTAELSVRDLERGRAPDTIDFDGLRYTVESSTPWTNQNGWRGSVCCVMGPTPP